MLGGGVLNVLGYNGKVSVICVMIDTLSVHGADASVVLKDQTGRFFFSLFLLGGGGGGGGQNVSVSVLCQL